MVIRAEGASIAKLACSVLWRCGVRSISVPSRSNGNVCAGVVTELSADEPLDRRLESAK